MKRIATPVDWLFAPEWLTIWQACFLLGFDVSAMTKIIEQDGVDLNDAGLIEKQSLWELQEALVDLLNWESWDHFSRAMEGGAAPFNKHWWRLN